MTTYVWSAGTSADWSTAGDWTPTGGPPGSGTPDTDVATLGNSTTSSTGVYTVSLNKGEVFDIATLNIGNSGSHKAPALSITGSLLMDTLNYTTPSGQTATSLTINAGGVLDIRTTISTTSTVAETLTIAASGKGTIGSGGVLELGSASTNNGYSISNSAVSASFSNNSATSLNTGVIEFLGSTPIGKTTSLTIKDVANGDEFIIAGANFKAGDTATLSGTTLTVNQAGVGTVFTMDNVSLQSGSHATFSVSGNDIIAVCYARGTMIRTPDGELPVERLRAGKQVMTLSNGEQVARPVKWLGHRRIDLTTHPRPETVAPIRILQSAFGDQMPHRDLLVSPDHAIFVDGKLICARQLVNGTTILQEMGWTAVDYFHVELAQHAILLAEGLPAESYIDTGNSGFFSNSGAPLTLHPDLTDESDYPTREAGSCAPFASDEASVHPVWQRLADRAVALGKPVPQHATTTDAGLHLVAKGKTVKPMYCDGNLAIFALPRHASEVRLVSRAQSPTEARPWLEDRRKLGVRVARVVLRSADDLREIPVDHPSLSKGWWAIERDGVAMRRWTDGDAIVPLPAMEGDALLEVHLGGTMTYVAETETAPERRVA